MTALGKRASAPERRHRCAGRNCRHRLKHLSACSRSHSSFQLVPRDPFTLAHRSPKRKRQYLTCQALEHRAGFEPANTGFADQRVCHFATGARLIWPQTQKTHRAFWRVGRRDSELDVESSSWHTPAERCKDSTYKSRECEPMSSVLELSEFGAFSGAAGNRISASPDRDTVGIARCPVNCGRLFSAQRFMANTRKSDPSIESIERPPKFSPNRRLMQNLPEKRTDHSTRRAQTLKALNLVPGRSIGREKDPCQSISIDWNESDYYQIVAVLSKHQDGGAKSSRDAAPWQAEKRANWAIIVCNRLTLTKAVRYCLLASSFRAIGWGCS